MPTQQALRHLETAFRNFFAGRAKYPTFHKKRGKQSATYTSTAFRWDAETRTLTLAKMDTPLHIHWSRPLPDGAHAHHRHRQPRYRWPLLRQHPDRRGDCATACHELDRWALIWACMMWWCWIVARRWAIRASFAKMKRSWPKRNAVLRKKAARLQEPRQGPPQGGPYPCPHC